MVRSVTPEIRQDLDAQLSPHALIGFLTIEHRNLPEPVCVVSDPLDFVVGGQLYVGCPFEFQLLTDEDQPPTTVLRVQNVDRRIGEALRTISDRARVKLEARTTADFDLSVVPRVESGVSSVIYGFRHFELVDVTVTPLEVSGTLMLRDYAQEPWPGKRATMARCPGLYR